MWGKVSFQRSRKPVIGNPPLDDNTLDKNVYQFSDAQNDGHRKALPALLPNPLDSTIPSSRPDSSHRITSSIYSRDTVIEHIRQRSLSLTDQFPQYHSASYQSPEKLSGNRNVDISPPDSPISMSRRSLGSRDSGGVSPIEDEPKQAFSTREKATKFTSHLPVLRKGVTSPQPDSIQPAQDSHKFPSGQDKAARWNDFSGEPRTIHSSKAPARVTPMNTHFQKQTPESNIKKIFGWSKEQSHPRKKFTEPRNWLPGHDNSFPPASHEPWKGPSGRSPMINPIQEKPKDRSASRVLIPSSNDRSKEEDRTSPGYTSFGITPSVVTTITAGLATTAGAKKRVASKEHLRASTPKEPIGGSIPPLVNLPEPTLDAALANLKLSTGAPDNEPASRFSVTTYDPTEAGSSTASPRESTDSPSGQSTEKTLSIMSRNRPVPSTVPSSKNPTRKPTPSQGAVDNQTSKALPQSPPEQEAQNRIEMLEAKLNSLERREANINTIIHELTQVIQPSSIAYDMAAREEIKKTVASLNNELAEIKREQHEIGLKIFKARKNSANDTKFWVQEHTG